jgi:hypothetical protein
VLGTWRSLEGMGGASVRTDKVIYSLGISKNKVSEAVCPMHQTPQGHQPLICASWLLRLFCGSGTSTHALASVGQQPGGTRRPWRPDPAVVSNVGWHKTVLADFSEGGDPPLNWP